jgi:hypothetical protein
MNGMVICGHGSDAAALSPAVALQLSVDGCARRFAVDGAEIDAAAISFFGGLLSNAEAPGGAFDQRLLISVFKGLWNPMLEGGFIFTSRYCSVPFVQESISLLSLDALESVLCESGFLIDSVDSLFEGIVCLGCDYFPLLRHV